MVFPGTTPYGLVVYPIIATGMLVTWPLKIAAESGTFTMPAWIEQLLFWSTIAAFAAVYSAWLTKNRPISYWAQVPNDPTRFVEMRSEHKCLWIPVRYWPWIYLTFGPLGALTVLTETPK
jgi:hypothetical protein